MLVAKNNDFNGEILHFNAVRFRITGSGSMLSTLSSLDNVHTSDLADIPMSALTNREPTLLANYIDQRGSLEGMTTEIDEVFNISKIIIYVKVIATGYPQ